jgi:hypothetical protein
VNSLTEATLRDLEDALRVCNSPAILHELYHLRTEAMKAGTVIDELDALTIRMGNPDLSSEL